MATCPYCGDGGKPYGNGKLICVRCGSVWADPAAVQNNSTGYSSSNQSTGSNPAPNYNSGTSGCGPQFLALALGAFFGYKVGGSTGAIVGLIIGILVAAKM